MPFLGLYTCRVWHNKNNSAHTDSVNLIGLDWLWVDPRAQNVEAIDKARAASATGAGPTRKQVVVCVRL
jgi:hypothetical protein